MNRESILSAFTAYAAGRARTHLQFSVLNDSLAAIEARIRISSGITAYYEAILPEADWLCDVYEDRHPGLGDELLRILQAPLQGAGSRG